MSKLSPNTLLLKAKRLGWVVDSSFILLTSAAYYLSSKVWALWVFRPISFAYFLGNYLFYMIYFYGLTRPFLRRIGLEKCWGNVFQKMFFGVAAVFGKVFNGFSVVGLENIPREGGALIIFFHARSSISDIVFLSALLRNTINRQVVPVVDRVFVASLASPALALIDSVYQRSQLVAKLQEGRVCAVAPGGTFEDFFSRDYEVLWCKRIGFAEVAKQTGVPIIPMFTTNCQQAFQCPKYGLRKCLLSLYANYKLFLPLPVFGLPVKMTTYLGAPLYCGPDEKPRDFADRVQAGVEALRDKHQRLPGCILAAFLERFGIRI